MKFISIAVKDFKELIRDRRGLFFILLFPIFFMMIFGFAFGGMGDNNTPHNIAVVNLDQGTINSTGSNVNYGNNLITVLEDQNYPQIVMLNYSMSQPLRTVMQKLF